jgi:Ca2+:H+ antiporter
MGKATEHLASSAGAGIGGLLNATFGNAAELIIALMGIRAGLLEMVKASLTGSIIGNILFVLGLATLFGGLKRERQQFNRTAAGTNAVMLALSVVALLIPAVFAQSVRFPDPSQKFWIGEELSLAISFILISVYVCGLIFSLKTHKHLFAGSELEENARTGHPWSVKTSILVLFIATIGIAVISEFLVGSLGSASKAFALTELFMGVIVIAIVGNAAEHSTAVLVALKDKMDLSIGIAVGSSIQVALFVAPILVIVSYLMGTPMDLEFTMLEVVAVSISVGVVSLISLDGESNWLEGVQLLAVYAILIIMFFLAP